MVENEKYIKTVLKAGIWILLFTALVAGDVGAQNAKINVWGRNTTSLSGR